MKMLNQSEVARLFGVSHVTIANWRRAGAPFEKREVSHPEPRYYYDSGLLLRWLIQHCIKRKSHKKILLNNRTCKENRENVD